MAACKSLRPAAKEEEGIKNWISVLSAELFNRLQDDFEIHARWPKTLSVSIDKGSLINAYFHLDPLS